MVDIYLEAASRLAAGQTIALAEIIEHQGSTPREEGARMLVWLTGDDGFAIAGTIGGGRLEAEAVAQARVCLSDGSQGALHPFDLTGEDAASMDMICGGSGLVLITVLTDQDRQALDLAAKAIQIRRRAWLVTLYENETTYTAYVDDDKEPVSGKALTEDQVTLMIDSTGPAMHTFDDEHITVSARALSPGPLLYIFGGGHVGLETAVICHRIGFDTVVIDDREEFANPERFPNARCIVAADEGDLPALILDEHVYIILMTRGHLLDYEWLKWTLSLPVMPKYVGMIGSRRKIAMIYKRLEQEGIATDRIGKVVSPIGLSIGAQTPEEIAVSIAAQLIQIRSGYEQ